LDIVADILLVAGAIGAAFYCLILSRRLQRFNDLEKGVGGAVAVLSAQVDDLRRTLDAARSQSEETAAGLQMLTQRAEATAKRLELLMASLHDLPSEPAPAAAPVSTSAAPVPAAAEARVSTAEPVAPSAPEAPPRSADPAGPERRPGEPMFVRHPRKVQEAAE
jgi:hypothetical protein